jgi:hypothetical protein
MKTMITLCAIVLGLAVSAPSALARGADPVNKGPLNVFRRDSLHCSGGWTFPGLIWGDRPISACMYKPNSMKKGAFGGAF